MSKRDVSSKTSKVEEASNLTDNSSDNIKVKLLEARTAAYFERMQTIYQASLDVTDAKSIDLFLIKAETAESIRSDFLEVLNEINELKMAYIKDYIPNYQSWNALEDLYCQIIRTKQRLITKQSPQSMSVRSRPQLPPIEIPMFNGDPKTWAIFIASFNSTVHQNNTLTDAEKLYYLIGKLSGKAQSVVSGVTPTGENYGIVYQSLIDKYEDKRMLASSYLDNIINFKNINTATASNLENFYDNFNSSIEAFYNLNIENTTDFILLHIALKKLDSDTIRAFEMSERTNKIPSCQSLLLFVKEQTKILQRTAGTNTFNINTQGRLPHKTVNKMNKVPIPHTYTTAKPASCLCTNALHEHLYRCSAFHSLTPIERFQYVKNNSFCINCLSTRHKLNSCNSTSKCKSCNQRHHTLLHFTKSACQTGTIQNNIEQRSTTQPLTASAEINCDEVNKSALSTCRPPPRCNDRTDLTVLLATALIHVYGSDGKQYIARCLLDSASHVNFITDSFASKLGLSNVQTESHSFVKGIGGSLKSIKGSVQLKIYSRYDNNIKFDIDAYLIDKITDNLPTARIDSTVFTHIHNLQLADDSFSVPGPIDILLGASLFPYIILPHEVKILSKRTPPAINTVLGYIFMGSVPTNSTSNSLPTCFHTAHEPVESIIKKFWELEEIQCKPAKSQEDEECELLYTTTTTRDPSTGRYTVALPFLKDPSFLGDSYTASKRRFLYLENKFKRSPHFKLAYDNAIRDYIQKGYLSPVAAPEVVNPSYFIPHHGVLREDKASTKLRVVLDASAKTSTDVALNDVLHSGPNLQGDLFTILLNFRLFAVALTADVRQMFLCIGIRESDRNYQRILYRFDSKEPIIAYQFNRVCFGLKPSPYLALRTVHKLFSDDGDSFPYAKNMLYALYMDDFVFSVQSESEALQTSDQLIQLLKLGNFDLVKWSSNSQFVLSSIPASHRLEPELEFGKTMPHKILGVQWTPMTDTFSFQVALPGEQCTKRTILSTVARLWDLLGFVAPVILHAKLLIKQLWLLGLDWDDEPPLNIAQNWQQFCSELPLLNCLKIPRHLGVNNGCSAILLGFADASEKAYGGVVYLHTTIAGRSSIQLVCAKSKVSPVKVISVARLELCASLLLSKLMKVVLDEYQPRYPISNFYAFSDSKVALCWIHASPHRWNVFVANRITKIINNIPAKHFHYVAGIDNPADCLSRGLTPAQIINHPLWFNGPAWLQLDPSQWPIEPFTPSSVTEVPEQKIVSHAVVEVHDESLLYTLCKKHSSWSKVLRIVIYIYRFTKRLPRQTTLRINASDLIFAENQIFKVLQSIHFSSDILKLKTNSICSPSLQRLKPFLDRDGLIRVGGRLSHSNLDYDHQHPIVLPRHDHISNLIVDYFHKKYCHAGPTLLMSIIRQRLWILSARSLIRNIIFKCNICFKLRPKSTHPQMADLKACRVRPSIKPFTHVGSDFAGPLKISMTRARGSRTTKAYICLFVCLTTRALHIELASDLSTACFLDAFKRFISRRGPVFDMYTDNGTNFIGAKSYLNDLHKFVCSTEFKEHIGHELCENKIQWHLNPPSAPHFGGDWESNVKSIKTHLFRVIGAQILCYEELATVLTQVEAVLNSRPLCSTLSSDPSEPLALTPAHFLTVTPLKSLPAPTIKEDRLHLLDRHTLLDRLVQSFWERWRKEYLHTLQVREKWNKPDGSVKEGTVVIINTDNIPPLHWPLGIIEQVHPASDGIIRVVTVKTAKGRFKRPVVKVCPLPSQ